MTTNSVNSFLNNELYLIIRVDHYLVYNNDIAQSCL